MYINLDNVTHIERDSVKGEQFFKMYLIGSPKPVVIGMQYEEHLDRLLIRSKDDRLDLRKPPEDQE